MPNVIKSVLILYVIMMSVVQSGCSKGPNDKLSIDFAYQYLKDMVPGIERNEIYVLKSYEKEGNIVIVIQSGGMLCDMPVIKGKNDKGLEDWIARGIKCTGEFESAEKARVRKRKMLIANLKKEAEVENKRSPYIVETDKSLRHDKVEFDENSLMIRYYFTLINVTPEVAKKTSKKEIDQARVLAQKEYCNQDYFIKNLRLGLQFNFIMRDTGGNSIFDFSLNSDICKKYIS